MNFEEIKKKTEAFVRDELFTLEPWILNVEWKEKLPKLKELRNKAKSEGLWLPQIPTAYGGLGLTTVGFRSINGADGSTGVVGTSLTKSGFLKILP